MTSSDQEAQENELLALASIYDSDDIFTASETGSEPGGQFMACLDLPPSFYVKFGIWKNNHEEHQLQFLPPIVLNFQLVPDYPSKNPPNFTLSCKWLSKEQLTRLCKKLDEIWLENENQEILFLWMSFLKDEAMEYLHIQSPLDLSNILSKKARKSSSMKMEKGNFTPYDKGQGKKIMDSNYDSRAVQDIASQELLLPALLEYNKAEKEAAFKRTLYACNVCFLEKLGTLCMQFLDCDHVYCKECMKDYFTVQITDGNVKALTCPHDKCQSQAHPSQVKELVGADLYARYDRLLLHTTLETMADIAYCPRPICQTPVLLEKETTYGCCSECSYVFCTICKLTYHGVSPCRIRPDEFNELCEQYRNGSPEKKKLLEQKYGAANLKKILDENVTRKWIEENSKQCPSCGSSIEKIDGCNKMTCTKCHSYFCWLCKAPLSRSNPYGHFNTLGSGCFSKLFEGVETNRDFFEEADFFDDDDDWEPY